MVEDWEECDILDRYTMKRMAYISRRFSNIIIFSHTISVFFYATGALLKQKGDNQTDARELIVKMELPFKVESMPIYVIVLITQFIHQSSAAAMVGVLNSFLITLVSTMLYHYVPIFKKKNCKKIIIRCEMQKRRIYIFFKIISNICEQITDM